MGTENDSLEEDLEGSLSLKEGGDSRRKEVGVG